MADLITHAASGWIVGVRLLDRPSVGWLAAGAVVPDLASRLPRVLLHVAVEAGLLDSGPRMLRLLHGLDFPHTPAGLVVVAVLLAAVLPSLLTAPLSRPRIAAMLSLGGAVHMAVDALQEHVEPSYYWFYPFSMERSEFGLISTDASLFALPLVVLVAWLLTPKGGRSEEHPPGIR